MTAHMFEAEDNIWTCRLCGRSKEDHSLGRDVIEQYTEAMSDERLLTIKRVLNRWEGSRPPYAPELLKEVERLRLETANQSALVHSAIDLAEEMKAKNVRLWQETEKRSVQNDLLDKSQTAVDDPPHPDTALLDKLEVALLLPPEKYKTRFTIVRNVFGSGDIQVRAACEAIGGPRTLRSAIEALEEK